MSAIQLTTVDRILSGLNRDLRGTDLNESDLIEWAGEALGFLEMPEIQEQSVAFLKVENFEADVPDGFQMVLQMSRYDKEEKDICKDCVKPEEEEEEPHVDLSCPDSAGISNIIDWMVGQLDISYRPYFDMQWQYIPWTTSAYYAEYFRPIRLANHTFFNSLVCKEKNLYTKDCGTDEYTIVGTVDKKLRFNFKEGYVALSYVRSAIDSETGYPLVPDNVRHITAIKYYIRWKIAEYLDWNGREGFGSKSETNMNLWLKYAKQAKNWTKMPKTIDQFQNLLEASHYLIPRNNRYYSYFGKLGRPEDRKFNDPNRRNHG